MSYNELINKHQTKWDGTPITMTSPTVRYVRIADGFRRHKDTGVFAADVSDANADHDLSDTVLTATDCYGLTLPDGLGNAPVVAQIFDDGTYVNSLWVYGGREIVARRGAAITPDGRLSVEPRGRGR